ncbi:MAG: NAD(P)/FAD-dependent oxidoreductase [Gammaproteobacteria bacterium]
MSKTAVIGAGVAGVVAARTLRKHNLPVNVFDKGRNIGGRCSTRDSEYTFNHGAPFFTVTDKRFSAQIADMERLGLVKPWQGRFIDVSMKGSETQQTTLRYVGVPDMRSIVESLGDGIDILKSCEIKNMRKCAHGWRLVNSDGSEVGDYTAVILAMPPEQARRLLPSKSAIFPTLSAFTSEPCWALMVAFDKPLPVDFDARRAQGETIETLVKQEPQRSNGAECWMIHSSAAWAKARLKADADTIARDLLAELETSVGQKISAPIFTRAHRWRLALPTTCFEGDFFWDDELLLGVCGDWCVSPDVQGAYLSGTACAEAAAQALKVELV